MAYVLGDVIEAVHFNGFSDLSADVYGVGDGDLGYGQHAAPNPSPFPLINVPIGKTVESQEWSDLINAISVCGVHQGTVTTPNPFSALLPEVAVGEIIEAHESDAPTSDPADIDSTITLITTNRLNFDAGSVTVFANQLNSSRGAAWSTSIEHRFTAIFPTADPARYFFNSGGEIRFRGSRSGGSATAQNTSWTNLLAAMGTVIMDAHSTTTTGSSTTIASAVGYYELTTSFQNILTLVSSGAYASNQIIIQARTMDPVPVGANNDNGRRLEFRMIYSDGHTNGFFDVVDGTITSDIDLQRATTPLFIDPPALATVVPLTSGS